MIITQSAGGDGLAALRLEVERKQAIHAHAPSADATITDAKCVRVYSTARSRLLINRQSRKPSDTNLLIWDSLASEG